MARREYTDALLASYQKQSVGYSLHSDEIISAATEWTKWAMAGREIALSAAYAHARPLILDLMLSFPALSLPSPYPFPFVGRNTLQPELVVCAA